jgi:Transposase DDE domain
MMVKAKGPVWHKKQKKEGIVPKGLRGLDKEASWGKSGYDGWVYGHGSFCITSYDIAVIGVFKWMPNSGNEAKLMEVEISKFEGVVKKVFMDSKADDQKLYGRLKQERGIQLVTVPRKGMDKSESRKRMIEEMLTEENKSEYRKRSTTVEPMQGIVKEIFELDTCWMRGDGNNRWLFASMGVAVQIAQWRALNQRNSTWGIKSRVLGI